MRDPCLVKPNHSHAAPGKSKFQRTRQKHARTHTHKLINQNHPTPRSPPNQLNIFQNQAARIPIGNRSTCHYKIDTLYIVCEILNIKHEIWYMVYYILNMIDYTLNIINPNYIYTYMFHMRYKPFYYIHCMLYMINYEKLLHCTE